MRTLFKRLCSLLKYIYWFMDSFQHSFVFQAVGSVWALFLCVRHKIIFPLKQENQNVCTPAWISASIPPMIY